MQDSAILCTHPKDFNDYYVNEMTTEGYSCPISELPFEYSDWNEKWYSPVCRDWFKKQRDDKYHCTLSDLYIFAHGTQFGITECAPILK